MLMKNTTRILISLHVDFLTDSMTSTNCNNNVQASQFPDALLFYFFLFTLNEWFGI